MVIWILNPFDDTPGEGKPQRYWTLADELSKQGHDVVWWSSVFSHRRKARRHISQKNGKLAFKLRLVECRPYHRNISVARIRNHRQWGNQLVEDALNAVGRMELAQPDIVVASMPPMEGPEAALILRKYFNCKVVVDIMDAWPRTLLQAVPRFFGLGHWVANFALSRYWRMLNQALEECDAVSAQSNTYADYARVHGCNSQVRVCYLGANSIDKVESAFLPERPIRFLYIGAMGRSYDLVTLIESAKDLHSRGRHFELHIAGEGEQLDLLQSKSLSWGSGTIHFHGFLQGEALADLMRSCDVGVVPMFPESGVAVPYKVGDYLAVGLAVINSLNGELKALLEDSRCGVYYEAGSSHSLISAMDHYIEFSSVEMKQQRVNSASLFSSKFDRAVIYPPFAEWLTKFSEQ